jgi:hypothetical protein
MAVITSRYFVAPLFAVAVLALPGLACAQSGSWRYPNNIGQGRFAYDRGYQQGFREGERDARRGERYAYQDERAFRNADSGYQRSYGDRERYRQTFRSGYAAGYSDAYRQISRDGRYGDPRYGGYGDPRYGYGNRGYGYGPAFDNGARDGYEKGQEDVRRNRSFDPLRHSWYRSGDRHYERHYGSRDDYKNVYRRGFQQGYERGFQEGRYRW